MRRHCFDVPSVIRPPALVAKPLFPVEEFALLDGLQASPAPCYGTVGPRCSRPLPKMYIDAQFKISLRLTFAPFKMHNAIWPSPVWVPSSPTCRWSRTGWFGSITSEAPPSSTFRKANTLSVGPGCPASGFATTRCGCNYMRWPTTRPISCVASNCRKRWQTGR